MIDIYQEEAFILTGLLFVGSHLAYGESGKRKLLSTILAGASVSMLWITYNTQRRPAGTQKRLF